MSTIASLLVNLGMNTAAFEAGTKRARRSMNQMASEINASASRMTSLATAAAGIFVGTRAIGFAKQQMEAIDKTAKLSDALGISTEQLVGFQRAADLAGVSGGGLNKSLEYLAKNLGQAVTTGGAAGQAFQRLGVDAQQLASGPMGEGFLKVAQAISELPTPAERAAAALDVFGRSGAELLPLLSGGRAGIEEITKAVIASGEAFTRMDASKVEAANDALTNMAGALRGMGTQVLVDLAPAIQTLAGGIIAATRAIEGFASAVFGSIAEMIKWAAYSFLFVKISAGVTHAIMFIVKAYRSLAIGQGIVNALMSASGTGLAAFAVGIGTATLSIALISSAFAGIEANVYKASAAMDRVVQVSQNVGSAQQALGNRIIETRKQFGAAAEYVGELDKKLWIYQRRMAGWSEMRLTLFDKDKREDFALTARAEALERDLKIYENAEKRLQTFSDLYRDLNREIAIYGKGPMAAELYDLDRMGLDAESLLRLRNKIQQFEDLKNSIDDAAEAERRLASIGQRWFEATRTPIERFSKGFDEITEALKAGTLSFETWLRASDELAKAYDREENRRGSGEFRQIENSRIDVSGLAGDSGERRHTEVEQLVTLKLIDQHLIEILRTNGLPM